MNDIELILPKRADQSAMLDFGLVALTEAIAQIAPDIVGGGLLGGEFGYGANYENDVFVMRTFYWGDCDCGHEEAEAAWSNENDHASDCYQTEYRQQRGDLFILDKKVNKIAKALCEKHGIPWNGGQGSAVHCTCDYQTRWKALFGEGHKPTCSYELPNFRHKATGFEVRWYKWIGRDMHTTGTENLREMFDECMKSLPATHPKEDTNEDA